MMRYAFISALLLQLILLAIAGDGKKNNPARQTFNKMAHSATDFAVDSIADPLEYSMDVPKMMRTGAREGIKNSLKTVNDGLEMALNGTRVITRLVDGVDYSESPFSGGSGRGRNTAKNGDKNGGRIMDRQPRIRKVDALGIAQKGTRAITSFVDDVDDSESLFSGRRDRGRNSAGKRGKNGDKNGDKNGGRTMGRLHLRKMGDALGMTQTGTTPITSFVDDFVDSESSFSGGRGRGRNGAGNRDKIGGKIEGRKGGKIEGRKGGKIMDRHTLKEMGDALGIAQKATRPITSFVDDVQASESPFSGGRGRGRNKAGNGGKNRDKNVGRTMGRLHLREMGTSFHMGYHDDDESDEDEDSDDNMQRASNPRGGRGRKSQHSKARGKQQRHRSGWDSEDHHYDRRQLAQRGKGRKNGRQQQQHDNYESEDQNELSIKVRKGRKNERQQPQHNNFESEEHHVERSSTISEKQDEQSVRRGKGRKNGRQQPQHNYFESEDHHIKRSTTISEEQNEQPVKRGKGRKNGRQQQEYYNEDSEDSDDQRDRQPARRRGGLGGKQNSANGDGKKSKRGKEHR